MVWLAQWVVVGVVARGASADAAPAAPDVVQQHNDARHQELQRARDLYQQGKVAYQLGKFAEAIDNFEASYRLSNRPALVYNLGLAYAQYYELDPNVAHLRRAKVLLANYLSAVDGTSEDARDAMLQLERVNALLAHPEDSVQPPPGTVERSPDPPVARYRPTALGYTGATLTALGVVGAATGAVLGVVSRQRLLDQRTQERDAGLADDARENQYRENLRKSDTVTYVSTGVGAAAAIAGVIMLVIDARRQRRAPRSTAAHNPFTVEVQF